LWPDTFNDLFFPEVLDAAARVLEVLGYEVTIPTRRLCCGRALYDFGMLDTAKQLWEQTFITLADAIASGTPIVGLEPSCVAAFRDELPNLIPHDPRAGQLAGQTKTLAEFLAQHGSLPDELRQPRRVDLQPPLVLAHYHCHHRSVLGIDADTRLLEQVGVRVETPEPGCCGMAGAFGFAPDKLEISLALGERALLPAVRDAAADTLIVADGFSCREQIRQTTGRRPMHLAELLGGLLGPLGSAQ
jgi:Fe-S oxidoreductase